MSDLISRQAAIETFDCSIGGVPVEFVKYVSEYADKMMSRINALPSADSHWIPCSERLPEAPFGCLVTVEDEEPMTGALFPNLLPYFVGWDGEQWNDADGEQCPFEVLAWMPLPEPYEGDKE